MTILMIQPQKNPRLSLMQLTNNLLCVVHIFHLILKQIFVIHLKEKSYKKEFVYIMPIHFFSFLFSLYFSIKFS